MASTVDFIEYVCEQISGTGNIRYKKMFGEYMAYVNDKPILLVCNDTVYVKMLDCVAQELKDAEIAIPYAGCTNRYILDIDNADFSRRVVSLLEAATPVPAPRKKAAKKPK